MKEPVRSRGPVDVEMGARWNQKREREAWVYRTFPEILATLGHASVDLVKLDIEGVEFAVLEDVLRFQPRQVALEVHSHIFVDDGRELEYATVDQYVHLLRTFLRHGSR